MFSFSHIHAGIFEGDIGWRSLKGLVNGVIITCYLFFAFENEKPEENECAAVNFGCRKGVGDFVSQE